MKLVFFFLKNYIKDVCSLELKSRYNSLLKINGKSKLRLVGKWNFHKG